MSEYICFCGAVDILKYLIINNVMINELSIRRAVNSGSEELISYLVSNNHSFDFTLNEGIIFHHNKIAKWLYENYRQLIFSLPNSIVFMNTEMLLYFLNIYGDLFDVNEQDYYGKTCLHWSVEQNDTLIVRYLYLKGINLDIKDENGKKAYEYAKTKEMIELFNKFNK